MATFIASPCAAPASTSGRTRRGCWSPSPARRAHRGRAAASFTRLGRSLDGSARSPRRRSTPSRRWSPSSARPRASTAASASASSRRRRSARAANGAELVRALRERAGVEAEVLERRGGGAARLPRGGPDARPARRAGRSRSSTSAAAPPRSRSARSADGVVWAQSFPVGSSSLADAHLRRRPAERDRSGADARATRGRPSTLRSSPAADDAVAVGGSADSLPRLVGPVHDGPALERALACWRGASAGRWRARTASTTSGRSSSPPGCSCSTRRPRPWRPPAADRPRRVARSRRDGAGRVLTGSRSDTPSASGRRRLMAP